MEYRINESRFLKEKTITLTEYDIRFGDVATVEFHPETEEQRARIESALKDFIRIVEEETRQR